MKLGILGGGQLGRMLASAAHELGIETLVLGQSGDCAFQVSPKLEAAFSDADALGQLANACDFVTYEFENVPETSVAVIPTTKLAPGRNALAVASDRVTEKVFLRTQGFRTADFIAVETRNELDDAVMRIPNGVLKTRRFGYDGKGQARIQVGKVSEEALHVLASGPCILEAWVPFARELSILGVRARNGEVRIWPLTHNRNEAGVLVESFAPAIVENTIENELRSSFTKLLHQLDYVGVLALELFDCGDVLLANEMAPRVHNSGHWTMDGAVTCQFENHVRAVCGLPLGATDLLFPTRMQNLLGSHAPLAEMCADGGFIHLYGKTPRAGRKLGHINWRRETQ